MQTITAVVARSTHARGRKGPGKGEDFAMGPSQFKWDCSWKPLLLGLRDVLQLCILVILKCGLAHESPGKPDSNVGSQSEGLGWGLGIFFFDLLSLQHLYAS